MLEIAGGIILAYLFIIYLWPVGMGTVIIVTVKVWVAMKALIKAAIELIEWAIRSIVKCSKKFIITARKLAARFIKRLALIAAIVIIASGFGTGIVFFLHYIRG